MPSYVCSEVEDLSHNFLPCASLSVAMGTYLHVRQYLVEGLLKMEGSVPHTVQGNLVSFQKDQSGSVLNLSQLHYKNQLAAFDMDFY
jgi:hypothetical protein